MNGVLHGRPDSRGTVTPFKASAIYTGPRERKNMFSSPATKSNPVKPKQGFQLSAEFVKDGAPPEN